MSGIPHDHYEPKSNLEKWIESRLPILGLIQIVVQEFWVKQIDEIERERSKPEIEILDEREKPLRPAS